MAYDAFISYSHAADGRLAPAVQAALQRLAKPWYRRRALQVFRDDTGLSVNPHLWGSIEAVLDDSEWFLLLTSPAAAQSEWVNREIEHWKTTKPLGRILPVVTDGTWEWDRETRDFTAGADAVPPALRGVFEDEPRHLDLRWARDETHLDLRNGAFRDAMAQVAAPLHGTTKDELEGEDIRMHRRALRLAWGAVAALAILLVASVVGAALAVSNSNRAEDKQREAQSRALAAQSRALPDESLDAALLLAVEAADREASPETLGALAAALRRQPQLLRILQPPEGSDLSAAGAVGFTADGAKALALSERPFQPGAGPQPTDVALIDWTLSSGQGHAIDVPGVTAFALVPSDDGLVATTSGSVTSIDRTGTATDVIDSAFPGIDVSNDGRFAVVFPRTGIAELWQLSPAERLWRGSGISAYEDELFSADDSRAAIPQPDGSLVVLDAPTGDALGVARESDTITAFAFSGSGDVLATGTQQGRISMWRGAAYGGQLLRPAEGDISNLAVSPLGETVLVATREGHTIALDGADGATRWEAQLFERVAFSRSGGNVLLTSTVSAELRDVDTGVLLATQRSRGINDIALTADGTRAATAGSLFNVWDLETGQVSVSRPDDATDAAWSRAGDLVVTYGGDGASLWNLRDPRPEATPLVTPGAVRDVAFDRSGRFLATGSDGTGALWVWDLGPRIGLGSVLYEPAFGTVAAASFDAQSGVLVHQNGKDAPLVAKTGDGRVELESDRAPFDVLLAPQGSHLVTRTFGSESTETALYDLESGELVTDRLGCGSGTELSGVEDVTVGSEVVVSVTADGVAVCDINDGELLVRHPMPDGFEEVGASSVAVVIDGSDERIAIAGGNGAVVVLDVASGDVLGRLQVEGDAPVDAIAFSPDGVTLAVGTQGTGQVGLWRWDSDDVQWFDAHRELVSAIAFSPDGSHLAVAAGSNVGTSSGDVQLLDLGSLRPIGEPLTAPFGGVLIDRVGFSPGGGQLYARDTSGTVVVWTVDEEAWRQLACAKAGRNLTAGEWDRYVVGEGYRATCDQWPAAP